LGAEVRDYVQRVDDALRYAYANHIVTLGCNNAVRAVTCDNSDINMKESALDINWNNDSIKLLSMMKWVCTKPEQPQNLKPDMKQKQANICS
jgi:hypothetical protein